MSATPYEGEQSMVQPADGQVYLFLRVKSEHARTLKQKTVRQHKVIETSGGTILGIANSVKVLEVPKRRRESEKMCYMVIRFITLQKAYLWFIGDPIFKQQDFPTANEPVQAFIVPLHYLPPNDLMTFALISLKVTGDPWEFQTEYIDRAAAFLDQNEVHHGVVSTNEITPLRNSWMRPDEWLIVHQYKSQEELIKSYENPAYQPLKQKRQELTQTTIVTFTLQ